MGVDVKGERSVNTGRECEGCKDGRGTSRTGGDVKDGKGCVGWDGI